MNKKAKLVYKEILDDLKTEQVNLRCCDLLFELFLKACSQMKLKWDSDWNVWTSKILTFFAELGRLYEFGVYLRPEYGFTDVDNQPTSEYLVDLCWAFEDEKYNRAYWIELALESELSSQDVGSIKYDFWKLTDVKAYTKVGIFAPRLRDKKEVLDEISSLVAINVIKIPTEKYLVILILNHGKAETESQRIEVAGYEINYLGDCKQISSKRFPSA